MSGYDAFISYSHRADDFRATALQGALQNLGRPFYRRKVLDVFRDETSLSANPALWPSIERALAKSRFFILMASPESSVSPWCTREIEWWLANRSTDTFLIILTAGEYTFDEGAQDFDWTRTTAISQALRGRFPVEPFYRDLRWAQRGDNLSVTNPRFRGEVLPIAAALHGKEPQELDGEDLRQFRRTRRFWRSAAVALGILTIISAGAAWIATQQSREARKQQGIAQDAETRALKERDDAVLARKAETTAREAEEAARKEEERQRKAAEEAERVAVEQRNEAVRQRNLAIARQLAIKAEFLQKDKPGMLAQSMLIAAESLRRARSIEADRTLRYGLQLLPRQIAELSFNPYLGDPRLSATSNNRFAFFTVPEGELQVVRFTEDGLQQLGKWQPDARPRSIAFDPRFGDRLIITTGKVWVWDLEEPAPKEVPGCEGELAAISGAGEHRTIACVSGPVTTVDVATGAVTEHDIRDVTGLAFDTFGEHLAMARADGSLVVVEVASWKELFRTDREDRDGMFDAATLVAFSTDGELVVKATGQDKSLQVREVATGTEVGTLHHPDIVHAIAFGDDGRTVATAGEDGIARVFASRGGTLLAELRHPRPVRDVRFTSGPSGSYSGAPLLLATASEDGTARLWDVATKREIARAAASAPIGHVVPYFSQTHRLATLSYDGKLQLWDVGREDVDGEEILATPLSARWLPQRREFGLAYEHLTWRIDPQRKRRSSFGDARDSRAAVWSADGATLLMGGKERSQVWNAMTQKVIADYPHGADAWALSPDGKTFAVAEEKAVKVLRVGRGAPIAVIPPPSLKAIAVNGTHLAIADLSSIVVRRFDDPAAKPVTIDLPNVDKMAFSPDGRFLTWANYEFGVFDVGAGRMLRLLDGAGKKASAEYFAFSPDGRLIAGASYDDFGIWSLPDGKLVLADKYESSGTTSEMRNRGDIASIAISGDGLLVAVGSTDGIASVRSIANGAEIIRVTMPEPDPGKEQAPIKAVALSDHGDYLLAASARANRVWPIAVDTLVAEACLRLRRSLTKAEWSEYLGSESYRATCEETFAAARR